MCCEAKLWLVLLLFLSVTYMQLCVLGEPQVPCHFIFGDSLSDSGNNNNLKTDAKVNYLPYGIDFPNGPTGRFTNGRTAADIITQLLGFDNFIPPYANTNGSDILLGVNYASGAAGIRKETGTHLGEDISLGLQLEHHKDIVSQITKKLGSPEKAQQHLNKCLYYMNIGSNDYLNNYFLPEHYETSSKFSFDQYAKALVEEYSTQLKALHDLGGRKFALIGLNLLGCVPREISKKNMPLCVEEENNAALLFNDELKALVDRFNDEFPHSKSIFINSAVISDNFKTKNQLSSSKNQLSLTDVVICCKVGSNGQCLRDEEPCLDRSLFAFFDEFHPSEVVNQFVAGGAYIAPIPNYAYPMDISHLVNL